MCGICGILEFDGAPEERRRRVERMTGAMVHRGPDDEGFYHDDSIALGFRRLSVIDLETGQQPIRLENDRAVIVLNGEIYNYRELRRELEPRHRFHSRGDVEVVLRLYAEEGIDCLKRLNGMFALAIWDRELRTLFLARDRFGIKPLFVEEVGGRLTFASEFATLLATDGGSRRTDRRELRHYLYQKYTSPTGTILDSVRSLEPATVLEIGPRGSKRYRYWEPPGANGSSVDEAEASRELARRLEAATRRQLIADVPVGIFLSGGVDSSTLAATVGRVRSEPLASFSVGFEGRGAVSELPAARQIAEHLGTRHQELSMDPVRIAGDLDRILSSLDGPLGDSTCVPTWYMCRLARQGVTVALSGEGADEIFGGYPRQLYDVWLDRLGPLGRSVLPTLMRLAGRHPSPRLLRRLGMPPGLERQLDWSRIFSREEIDALAVEPLSGEDEMLALHDGLASRWRELNAGDPLNARLATDRELFLPGDLLPKVDRMSMAHSLEVRVPYLDHEVADWMLSLPGRLKARGLEGKRVLKRITRELLPESVARRPKQGFDAPVSQWLRGALREPLTDYLAEASVRRRGLFRPEPVGRMVREHLDESADHGEKLWLLLALESWQRQVLDRSA